MIPLCTNCDLFLEDENQLRWCCRANAGYDINPVDGTFSGGPEHHPHFELAFIERQADFRCGTNARYFVPRNINSAK